MSTLQEYKCPCCDGAITFDSTSQKMKCPYCTTEFDVETLASYDAELGKETESRMDWAENDTEWSEGEKEELCAYSCTSCGGEIVSDSTTAATKCPYCGNPVVMMQQFRGSLRPDLVIPFKLDKKAAKKALFEHYKGKKLLPSVFKDENYIDEVRGVYVPVWLFDARADASIRYKATRTRFFSDIRYNYTETSYYSVSREGTLDFEGVPVDGSSKLDNAIMESLEPYDYSEAVDFKTAYLAGYLADKYDVDADTSIARANERIKKSTQNTFASTVNGYTSVVPVSASISLKNGTRKYALCPVWLLSSEWNGERYIFAMNGQTGKLVGNLPLDKAAYRKWLFGLTGIVGAACFVLSFLLWLI